MPNLLNVGKVVNTQGIRGEVRVIASTDFPEERFATGSKLFLEHPDFSEMIELKVAGHRQHKNFDLLKFEGYPNINDVEKFKGGVLKVSNEMLSELEENEFYYHEVIGCDVVNTSGEQLGKIKEILSTGANDVWIVQRQGQKDLLLPYIEDVIKEVNIEEKVVTVELMEGLE
jgi:16S rRNA processing protein RimM